MVSGVDSPLPQNPLIEASANVVLVNQARQGAVLNSSQLVVGKQFQAEVVSSLTDGTYIVKVADVAARMQLPDSPQVGTKLSLTLIAGSPRPTFLLNPSDPEENGQPPTTSSAILGTSVKQLIDEFNQSSPAKTSTAASSSTNPALTRDVSLQTSSTVEEVSDDTAQPRLITLPTGQPDSAPASFSSAGKLINQLIQTAPQQSTVVNVTKMPLLTVPTTDVNAMAKALQTGVNSSGIFYESHLLQWAEGKMSTPDLMKEPQAGFPVVADNAANEAENGAAPGASLSGAALPADDGKINLAINLASAANATNATIALPKEAAPIIQQQLQTLEQQRFVWHGELWPGQSMHWEISQDGSPQQRNQQEKTWQSDVQFELPQLGGVSAMLQLTGTHLTLTVSTRDAATTQTLQNHASELVGAINNTGTQLDALLIKTRQA